MLPYRRSVRTFLIWNWVRIYVPAALMLIGLVGVMIVGEFRARSRSFVSPVCPPGYDEIDFGKGAYACQHPPPGLNPP